jgi:AraC-like DNA-binding protein
MLIQNIKSEQTFSQLLMEHVDEELMIFENSSLIPNVDKSDFNQYVVITLCHQGWIKGEYDLQPMEFRNGTLTVHLPNHTLVYNKKSEDYKATHVVLSLEFAQSLKQAKSIYLQTYFNQRPIVTLTDEEITLFLSFIEPLRFIIQHKLNNGKELLRQQFNLIFQLMFGFETFKKVTKKDTTLQESTFERFHDAIVKYHRQSREIVFYAEKLCFTPKYLSSIIKRVSGKSASYWIDKYVIKESKAMLRSSKQMSILEISEHMGFVDQASFSKYFKKHTGVTPSEYRVK